MRCRTSAVLTLSLETAHKYRLSVRMWKNVVDPKVTTGVRTSGFEMTWMRKISATERLPGVRVYTPASSASRPSARFFLDPFLLGHAARGDAFGTRQARCARAQVEK